MNPWSLKYWDSGEYQAAREKLDDDQKAGFVVNPDRKSMFRSLSLTPEKAVRCVIMGQDPYPQHVHATGVAFSIPRSVPPREFPPTLRTFLTEYSDDLGYGMPSHGCLEDWCSQGVLLWNAIPSCREGQSLSHDWRGREWLNLTSEIVERLNRKGIVFALLGTVARSFRDMVSEPSRLIECSHPSPRGSLRSNLPFVGSRLFSRINANLIELGMEAVDWRIDGSVSDRELRKAPVDGGGGRLLDNITGYDLGGHPRKNTPNLATSTFEV
jgi:uracil-DNA glycosylase